MKRDDDPQLWDLLGHSAEPEVSPFFARNVLREVRAARDKKTLSRWFHPRRLIPIAGLAGIIAAIVFWSQLHRAPVERPLETLAIETMESEVIADLEELFTTDENNRWEESVLP